MTSLALICEFANILMESLICSNSSWKFINSCNIACLIFFILLRISSLFSSIICKFPVISLEKFTVEAFLWSKCFSNMSFFCAMMSKSANRACSMIIIRILLITLLIVNLKGWFSLRVLFNSRIKVIVSKMLSLSLMIEIMMPTVSFARV